MHPLLTRSFPVAIGLVVLLLPTLGAATIVADWDLRQVLAHADAVVIGTVVEQRVVPAGGDGGLLTETTIEVDRWLRPSHESRPRVTLSQLGGQDGQHGHGIAGDVRLRTGQRVLLMLERVSSGRMMIVGLVLGAYFAVGDVADRPTLWTQHVGVSVARSDGSLALPPGLRTVELSEVETLLREQGR